MKLMKSHMGGSRGSTGGRGPPEKSQKSGFLSNTGPDPLKITKPQCQHSMLGNHRPASKTPLIWRFAGEPMMANL